MESPSVGTCNSAGSESPGLPPLADRGGELDILEVDKADLYSLPVQLLTGETTSLDPYRGKVLLIVNVASDCGFTPQYEGLEALHRAYQGRGFSVLGFPCDQFGGQEPGSPETILAFCKTRFDVTFPLFAKIEVNGPHAHPLYELLKSAAPGVLGSQSIKWNFTKFLVDRGGRVHSRYAPTTTPASLTEDILALL